MSLPRDRPAILISYPLRPDYPNTEILVLIPFLFLDDGKGFRIVQNGSRQKT